MSTLFMAISPIFGLIFIGYGLKRLRFPNIDFWPQLDKLTYYILIPSLLIHKLSTATLDTTTDALIMVKVVFMSLIVLSLLLVLIQKFLHFKGNIFTSVFQGAIRYNTYVYLGLVAALFGDEGIVFAAFLITFAIPFINILCVGAFSIYVDDEKFSFAKFSKFIISNPLILACLLGGFLNFSGIGLPFAFEPILKMLGAPGIPLGLLSIGVGLRFKSLGNFRIDFWLSSLLKLVIFPLIAYIFSLYFGLGGIMETIVLLFAAMPTAASAYILARQMGGDVDLMSTLITGQTLLSLGSLAILLSLLKLTI